MHKKIEHTKSKLGKAKQKWNRCMQTQVSQRLDRLEKLSQLNGDDSVTLTQWWRTKEKIANGHIASTVYDSRATSNFGRIGDPFQPSNKKSNKVFLMPTGETVAASTKAKLLHRLHKYGP